MVDEAVPIVLPHEVLVRVHDKSPHEVFPRFHDSEDFDVPAYNSHPVVLAHGPDQVREHESDTTAQDTGAQDQIQQCPEVESTWASPLRIAHGHNSEFNSALCSCTTRAGETHVESTSVHVWILS